MYFIFAKSLVTVLLQVYIPAQTGVLAMSGNAEEEWYLLAYVLSSKYRAEILKKMKNSPLTPSEVSRELNCPLSRVSEALKDLERVNLVVCITPKRSKGRLYKLTEKGEKILQRLLNYNKKRT